MNRSSGTRRRHSGIELAQASRRRIARLTKLFFAARQSLPVESFEARQGH